MTQYKARVEWIIGPRALSTFVSNAGLGITGCGVKQSVVISYKPGEEVTEERVLKAIQRMIEISNTENTEMVISCPRVISIYEKQNEPNN